MECRWSAGWELGPAGGFELEQLSHFQRRVWPVK